MKPRVGRRHAYVVHTFPFSDIIERNICLSCFLIPKLTSASLSPYAGYGNLKGPEHVVWTVPTRFAWKRGSRVMLGSQRSHCLDRTHSGVVDSSENVRRKRRMSSTIDKYRAGILDGHRDQQIRRLRLPRHSHSR